MTVRSRFVEPVLLSEHPAREHDRRFALWALLVSCAIFIAAVPLAKTPLTPVWAFIPVYEAALVVNDLITAVLLFGQFAIGRSRALLVLAAGYAFTAFIEIAHALTFPGLFSQTGLLGAGPHSTAWLYMFWHGGFPLFVIAYALLRRRDAARGPLAGRPALFITAGLLAALAAVVSLATLATAGEQMLPAIMVGSTYAPAYGLVTTSAWLLSIVAIAVVWRRRPHSVLDLWLMVVMFVWIFEVALSAVLNAGRFDLGFYVGRIYGLAAASFILGVLLFENAALHARLAKAYEELIEVNKELDAFSYSVSHDLRAPARGVEGFTRILEEDYGARLDAEGRRLLSAVRESARRMGLLIEDLLAFARLGRQPIKTQRIELEELVNQTIAELVEARTARRIDFSVGDLGSAEGDPALLKQAFANLVGNAIKFTRDRDPAVIEIGRKNEGEPVYYVKDNGVGFDMSESGKIFGVFQRLDSAREYEGTGVGLAIVQKIINRHGGRVWVDAEPGRGATFLFTLQGVSVRQAA